MSSTTDTPGAEQPIDLIVVLGMHRSGTSALTRGLAALGIDLGQHLIPGIDGDNAKGYFEDAEIHYVCDKVLETFGHNWSSLEPLGDADFAALAEGELMDTAIRVMSARVGPGKVYGLKNPRMATILPFWKQVFRRMNLKVGYVVAVRNPLSVASSMVRSALERDVSFEKSHLLWLTHLSSSMAQTGDEPRVVVDYDLLLDDPSRQLQRLAAGLGLPEPAADLLREYAEGFLHDGLRHSVFSPEDLAQADGVPGEVIEAYRFARGEARSTPPHRDAAAQACFNQLWHQLFLVKFVLAYLDRREAQFATASTIAGTAQAAMSASPESQDAGADRGAAFSQALTQGLRSQFEQAHRARQTADAQQGARLLQMGRELRSVLDRLGLLDRLEGGIGQIGSAMSGFEQALADVRADLQADSAQQRAALQALHEAAVGQAATLGQGMNAQFGQVLDDVRHFRQVTEQQAEAAAQHSAALAQQVTTSAEALNQAQRTSLEAVKDELTALTKAEAAGVRQQIGGRVDLLAEAAELREARATILAGIGDLGTSVGGLVSQGFAAMGDELERSTTRHEALVTGQAQQAAARLGELEQAHQQALEALRAEHAEQLATERQRAAEFAQQAERGVAELRRLTSDAQDRLAALAQQHDQRAELLRTEYTTSLASERQRSAELLDAAERQASELRRLTDEQLAELREAQQTAVRDLRAEHAQALAVEQQRAETLRQRHEADVNELRRQAANQLTERDQAQARAQEAYHQQLAQIRRQFDTTLAAMETRVREQQAAFELRLADHKEQIAQHSAAHATEVQALRQHQAEVLQAHDAALREQAALHARQTQQLAQAHASELASVKEMAAAEARRIGEDRDQRIHELQAQAERARNRDRATIMELEQTLQTIRGWRGMGLITWWNGKGQPPTA